MKIFDVLIVGGGASGLLAAIAASEKGAEVCLLEKNPRVGKKILATGNGRCNYTNVGALPRDYNRPDFVAPAFSLFGPGATVGFFRRLGIVPKVEDEGKTFPLSEQASSVLDVLLYRTKELGVEIVADAPVNEITVRGGVFSLLTTQGTFQGKSVVLATGGKAMPASGSDGSGLRLAQNLGHRITPVFPSLVKLRLSSPHLAGLDGLKFPGTVQLLSGNQLLQADSGDVLFTDYGISGPPVLQLSRTANALLQSGKEVFLRVIPVSSLSRGEILARFREKPDMPAEFALVGLLHKRLIPAVLKEAGIPKLNVPCASLSPAQIERVADLLAGWDFPVTGSLGFEEAQVTAGGVDTRDVDPPTLGSKKIKGLYFAGEILDVDGPCGGYNLQWAWTSGYVAGTQAAEAALGGKDRPGGNRP